MADTIAAIATSPGGAAASASCGCRGAAAAPSRKRCSAACPERARRELHRFLDAAGDAIDEGLALFFPGPASFTGEDVLELHGHGGPVVMDLLLRRVLELGARAAEPGEFTQRAFLNDKLDLAQAEAVADLIDSGSAQAARAALRSLQGEFSAQVHELAEAVLELRMWVEAAIDFPEEEVDFLGDRALDARLDFIRQRFAAARRNRAPGRAAARRADARDRRPAERRQVEPAEPPRRLRRRDRHAGPGHHARRAARTHRDRRPAAARARHRRPARVAGRGGGGGHPPRAPRNWRVPIACCSWWTRPTPHAVSGDRCGPRRAADRRAAHRGLQQDRPRRRRTAHGAGRPAAGPPECGHRGRSRPAARRT